MTLYRMHDSDPTKHGMIETPLAEAEHWNSQGYGIFRTVNEFAGPRRIENLIRIRGWAIDIDDGDKAEQAAKIMAGPLMPTRVVETKRGYQCYWDAIDGTAEHWNEIVLARLVPWYGADANARDIARVLRVPGYYHRKDPLDPFLVREVYASTSSYTEAEMMARYPDQIAAEAERKAEYLAKTSQDRQLYGATIWDRIYELDCAEGLARLSGHSAVGGERFSFMPCRNGNKNILVDGKGTSCWVDRAGRIGSLDKGGPTLIQWLQWYGASKAEAVRVVKELFPQVADDE